MIIRSCAYSSVEGHPQGSPVSEKMGNFTVRFRMQQGFANNKGADQPAQSDQRLCYSLLKKYHIYTCYKRIFTYLASLCSCRDWFEYHFVGTWKTGFLTVWPK